MLINAYAAEQAKQSLVPFSYEVNALRPHEVVIQVSHCGICHSDIHLIDDDWGMTEYPLVPGHEIVGTIAKMGSSEINAALDHVRKNKARYRLVLEV